MNIYEYFKTQLGRNPKDKTLRDLPIESPCGDGCKRAIDACNALINHIHEATDDADDIAKVVEITEHVVSVYWRG